MSNPKEKLSHPKVINQYDVMIKLFLNDLPLDRRNDFKEQLARKLNGAYRVGLSAVTPKGID